MRLKNHAVAIHPLALLFWVLVGGALWWAGLSLIWGGNL